jgi:hypothetical protein
MAPDLPSRQQKDDDEAAGAPPREPIGRLAKLGAARSKTARAGVVNEPDWTRFDEDAGPAGAFRLRSEAPAVMRLSRRVLTGLVGIGAIVIFAAPIFTLSQGSRRSGGGSELYNTDNKPTPDGLTSLPRDYGGLTSDKPLPEIPGPPSPGGLNAIDPEQQRLVQENEAARLSRLFATTGTRERPAEAAPATPAADTKTAPGQGEAAPLDPGALLNMEDRKLAFMSGPQDRHPRPSGKSGVALRGPGRLRPWRGRSSPAYVPTFPARSWRRSPRTSMTARPAATS